MRKKQESEIERAKERRTQVEAARAASTGRLTRQKEMAKATEPKLDSSRLGTRVYEKHTKAHAAGRLTADDLDAMERQRSTGGAHDTKIASGGYDLKFSGRAIPLWTRGAI